MRISLADFIGEEDEGARFFCLFLVKISFEIFCKGIVRMEIFRSSEIWTEKGCKG